MIAMSPRCRFAVLAALLAAAGPAAARDIKAGDLLIRQAWVRATPAGATVAAGYVTVVNAGKTPDRLTGGSFAGASGFAIHDMRMDGTVMTMRPTGPLVLPPGGTLSLSPAGQHIMVTGLSQRLVKGTVVDGTLVFDHAGTVPVSFAVEGIGAKAPAMSGDAMPGMSMQ